MGEFSADKELIPIERVFGSWEPLNEKTIVHYTSISTLFKILRNKTIRFNRIDNVNDLEEKDHLLINDNYRRVFIACFSNKVKESIPMWRIYTTKETGVMLKFRLKDQRTVDELIVKDYIIADSGQSIPIMNNATNDLRPSKWQIQYDAVKIEYTDNIQKPSNLQVEDEDQTYDIPFHFGLEKRKVWNYETELRLRSIIHSFTGDNCNDLEEINSLFASINFDAIEKIIVVFNPWISKEDWTDILRDFVGKQKINCPFEFRNSALYQKIRI